MPKRSLLEIYANILEAVSDGVSKPTRIMYSTNLSWLPLQRHLDILLQKEFLIEKREKKRKIYEITENGRRFLYYFQMARNELATGDIDLEEDLTLKKVDRKIAAKSS